MRARGHEVYGSDRQESELTHDLVSQGIVISYSQDGSSIPEDIDLFVYSEAIPQSSPERQKAQSLGVPQMSYFQAVGELSKGKDVICIAGSHGKSTTTALLAKVLIDAGYNPNVVLGTKMPELGNRNWRASDSDLWIIEACEYRRSFLYLTPKTVLLTTVDIDHFDAYNTQEEYSQAYIDFLALLPKNGTVVGHGNDADVRALLVRKDLAFIDADAVDVADITLHGQHMRENANLALAAAESRGVEKQNAQASLNSFSGTWRRMEIKGTTKDGAVIIDDYGHHPREVAATLAAMREEYPKHRILCVFQPHMHNRTLRLWDEFASAFSAADLVLLSDVYDARPDTEAGLAEMTKLAKDIELHSKTRAIATGALQETEQITREQMLPNDIVICMGAGSVTTIASHLVASS